MDVPMLQRTKNMVDQKAYISQRIIKEQEQVKNLRDENREFEFSEFMSECLKGKMMDYHFSDARDIRDLRVFIDHYVNELTRRIQVLSQNGESTFFSLPLPLADVPDAAPLVVADVPPDVVADAAAVTVPIGFSDHIHQYHHMNMQNQNQQEQPGFGYQHQMVPGMRPGYFGPMMQPGQQGPRPGGRRSGDGPMRHQPQQPMPFMQPQMMPRGPGYRYPPGRNMPDGPMAGGMFPVAYDMNGMPLSQPMSAGALASSLAQASPGQQRTLLGESLYPLVDQIEHENAAKVTGMLLEMDQTEVLHLLESPDALKAKVSEALDVLRNVNQPSQVSEGKSGSPSDLLASLSINDHL